MSNTTENNKLIAEFMMHGDKETKAYFQLNCTAKDLKYNSSWDWLMPVITNILHIASEIDEIDRYSIVVDQIPQINHTYDAVIEFINWHNKNK